MVCPSAYFEVWQIFQDDYLKKVSGAIFEENSSSLKIGAKRTKIGPNMDF